MLASIADWQKRLGAPKQDFVDFEPGDPRRLEHICLEQQKERAKDLLRGLLAADTEAQERLQSCAHPCEGRAKLSDAQAVIAAEHGFHRWVDFTAHVEAVQIARDAIATGQCSALDADTRTLHIRCGWDIAHALSVAGFVGDFLVFSDPYVQGPLLPTEDLDVFVRARVEALVDDNVVEQSHFLSQLLDDYAELEEITHYPRVMLWFEHDSYDQLIVARLLKYLNEMPKRPAQVEMISITHFPGVKRFNGIGQLPPEAMRVLWQQFRPVTSEQLGLGSEVWQALTASTPEPLHRLVQTDTPALPTMAKALSRHLQELPSVANGLNLTEQLTLECLSALTPKSAAHLFGAYTNRYEPLPFMGDTLYWRLLDRLAQAEQPAITLQKDGEKPNRWQVALTSFGRALLAGEADWVGANTVQRWVGGVRVDSTAASTWRLDDTGSPKLVAH